MALLRQAANAGIAVIVATHSAAVAAGADTVYELADGRVQRRLALNTR